MIVEHPQMNSGMAQGTLLKRTVATKPDGSLYVPDDFRIGNTVRIFGVNYNIVDSDNATRRYLEDDTPALSCPVDAFEEQRKALHSSSRKEWGAHHSKKNELKKFIEAKLGNTVDNKGRDGFLKFGNNVLKFLCIWDDTASLYGDVNEFTLTYYLSDDTVTIFSIPGVNSGRDQFTRLLRRAKLPKNFENGSYSSELSVAATESAESTYHWTDLAIGSEIFVFGRSLVIVDADASTRDFYAAQGRALPRGTRPPSSKMSLQKVQREIPPYNGFGSEEDSLLNCTGPLSNTAPPKKKMGENKTLAYVCRLMSQYAEDRDRRFVITYFVTDGTLKVQEIPGKNSGFVGGVFLSRSRMKGRDNEYVNEKSFYLGAKLLLQKHVFEIIDTNENTMRWMELHRDTLVRANFTSVIEKLRYIQQLMKDVENGNFLGKFESLDREDTGLADKDMVMSVLSDYDVVGSREDQLSLHEVIVIVRTLSNRDTKFEYKRLISELLDPSTDDDLYSL
eukprot:CAMPEP_0182427432 /NCGR_PEP_ID=MMETSP1167-20130531/17170_1 /TAXON_ID=2988 /ORGANISM="Mallomonas Sp, Strain CCMP3275" /LENGTH=504 /DNA_ID=CAMNT_0024609661 /DNA_START=462 /DNA_END=1976 /DNA_ORIENTATION=-